eukprot:tig00000057_g59.t1
MPRPVDERSLVAAERKRRPEPDSPASPRCPASVREEAVDVSNVESECRSSASTAHALGARLRLFSRSTSTSRSTSGERLACQSCSIVDVASPSGSVARVESSLAYEQNSDGEFVIDLDIAFHRTDGEEESVAYTRQHRLAPLVVDREATLALASLLGVPPRESAAAELFRGLLATLAERSGIDAAPFLRFFEKHAAHLMAGADEEEEEAEEGKRSEGGGEREPQAAPQPASASAQLQPADVGVAALPQPPAASCPSTTTTYPPRCPGGGDGSPCSPGGTRTPPRKLPRFAVAAG